MKPAIKICIIMFFGLLPAMNFAGADDWWYGGAARMMSIGEVSVSIPDYSNVYDLYNAGFATALLWRDEKSVEGLSPAYNLCDNDLKDYWGGGNFTTARLGDRDILAFGMYYSKQDGRTSYTIYNGGNTILLYSGMNSYGFGGTLQYIHKFAKDIGVSVSVFSSDIRLIKDYNYYNQTLDISGNSTEDKSKKNTGIIIGIDRHIGDFQLPFISDMLPRLDLALSMGYKVNDKYRTENEYHEIMPPADESLERQNDKLINVNIGLAFTAPKRKSNIVFNITKSFVVDYKYYYNSTTTYPIATQEGLVIDETRVDVNAKLNYYITDFLLASAKIRWKDPDYGYTAGLAIVTDNIRMPLEYTKNDIDWKAESLGGGLEYNVIKPLYIRLGARYYGYYNLKMNYTAGLGLETKNFLCDFGMVYETDKGAWTNTRLLADVKAVW